MYFQILIKDHGCVVSGTSNQIQTLFFLNSTFLKIFVCRIEFGDIQSYVQIFFVNKNPDFEINKL